MEIPENEVQPFFNQEGKCALWLDDDIYMQSEVHMMHACISLGKCQEQF